MRVYVEIVSAANKLRVFGSLAAALQTTALGCSEPSLTLQGVVVHVVGVLPSLLL